MFLLFWPAPAVMAKAISEGVLILVDDSTVEDRIKIQNYCQSQQD